MAENPFQGWLEKAANDAAILACAVCRADQSICMKSFDASFPEPRIKELLQCLAEVAFGLRSYQPGGSRLRWVFEHGQLHVVRRLDNAFAVLIVRKDGDAAVEKLFADFIDTVCPVSEKPSFRVSDSAEPGDSPPSGRI